MSLNQPGIHVAGDIRFGPFSPIRYDIMGPFRWMPFMQCRHSVFSMRHSVNGKITINDTVYSFSDDLGYMEGDRGHSFPQRYAWTQSFCPGGSLMLSLADIPLAGCRFIGIIGVLLLKGKEYRLATYLGAKAEKITQTEFIVRQGRFTLTVQPKAPAGHPLHAPVAGAMSRVIREHPACPVSYQFSENGIALLEWESPGAAFEYEC